MLDATFVKEIIDSSRSAVVEANGKDYLLNGYSLPPDPSQALIELQDEQNIEMEKLSLSKECRR